MMQYSMGAIGAVSLAHRYVRDNCPHGFKMYMQGVRQSPGCSSRLGQPLLLR
jgi:hypothetical protein